MHLPDNYFAAYRSLKLTRDADGVLVVEFHSKDGPFRFTAQDHTEFVDAFYRIAQDRENKILILTSRRGVHSRNRFLILRQRRRSWRLEPGSRRRRSAARKYSQYTRASHRVDRGTSPCALRVGYGLSLEGASAADLVKSMRAQNEPVAQKGKVA